MRIEDAIFVDEYDAPPAIMISGAMARVSGEALPHPIQRVAAGPDVFEVNGHRYDETGAPALGQQVAPRLCAVRIGGTWIKRITR